MKQVRQFWNWIKVMPSYNNHDNESKPDSARLSDKPFSLSWNDICALVCGEKSN